MLINGSLGKVIKMNGAGLYNYIKNRSSSISSTISTMNEDQPKNNNDKNKAKKPDLNMLSNDVKEETENFVRKKVNEVSLSTVKSTQMIATKTRQIRNCHFNSGTSNHLISKTAKANEPIFPIKIPHKFYNATETNGNALAMTTSIPVICKPPELSNKTFSISNMNNSSLLNKLVNDNINNQDTEPNDPKDFRRNSLNNTETNISSNMSLPSKRRLMQKNSSMEIFRNVRRGVIEMNKDIISIEDLVLLEDRYLDIISSIKKKKSCLSECFEWWSYYFDSSLYGEKYDEFFNENTFKIIIHTGNNLELFAVLFCYYISEDAATMKKHNESLYNIFVKLHFNYLYICYHILSQHQLQSHQKSDDDDDDDDGDIWQSKMMQYVKRELINKAQCKIDLLTESFIVNEIKQNCKMIAETIKAILNNYSKESLFNSLVYHFSNLTKLTNNHMKEFFREDVYNAYMQKTHQTRKILQMNHKKSKSMMSLTEIKPPYLTSKRAKPYTLVLDLDETLISTKVFTDSEGMVIFRPGLIDFLSTLKTYYELVSFTAASQDYAESVLEMIEEKQKYFDYHLYQCHTVQYDKEYIKDISLLGRDLSTVIIVDNLPHTFKLQKANGILIKSFYGNKKTDSALTELLSILIKIAKDKGDVRKSIQKYKNDLMNKVTSNLDYLNHQDG